MAIEHVTRGLQFDNLLVEVSVYRWICDACGRRQCFHDVPTPYNEPCQTPEGLGWRIRFPMDDGDPEGCYCPQCKSTE